MIPAHMGTLAPKVREYLFVPATGRFQRIRQHRQPARVKLALWEGTLGVSGLSKTPHGPVVPAEPGILDGGLRTKLIPENVAKKSCLGSSFRKIGILRSMFSFRAGVIS